MARIEVRQTKITTKSITTKKGQPMELHFQAALLIRDDGVVLPVDLRVEDATKPIALGLYALDDRSFQPGPYNEIQFRLTLGEPLKKAA